MSVQEKPSRPTEGKTSLPDQVSSLDAEPVDALEPTFWDKLRKMGFFDVAVKAGTVTLSVLLFLVVIWVMGRFYTPGVDSTRNGNSELAEGMAPTAQVVLPEIAFIEGDLPGGVSKQASLHTILPSRGRTAMETYIVQAGDTLFSIAERFGLQPETILWGNRYTLGEDPHTIYPGQTLNILPMDGVIHKWSAGEGLNGVAKFYQVHPRGHCQL